MSEKKDPEFPTLIEHATETKQWVLIQLIKACNEDRELNGRLRTSFFGWVQHALGDPHDKGVDADALMMARTILIHAQQKYLSREVSPAERFNKLRDDGLLPKIAEVRANAAIKLLEMLTSQPLHERALQETRYYLLKNIAFAWRSTGDQTAADKYFNAVMSADRSKENWAGMTEKVLRDTTRNEDPKVSSERLRLALRSKAVSNIEESLLNVLKIAWAKSLHPEDFETHLDLQKNIDKRVS